VLFGFGLGAAGLLHDVACCFIEFECRKLQHVISWEGKRRMKILLFMSSLFVLRTFSTGGTYDNSCRVVWYRGGPESQ
jgi:hypothetical protein